MAPDKQLTGWNLGENGVFCMKGEVTWKLDGSFPRETEGKYKTFY
jgi:hypothetical protein